MEITLLHNSVKKRIRQSLITINFEKIRNSTLKRDVLDSQTSLKFINIPRGSFRWIFSSKDYKFVTRYSNFSQILKLYERFRLGLIIFPFKRRSISLNCACARIIQNYTKAGGGHSSRNNKKKRVACNETVFA